MLLKHEVATAYERGWSTLKNGELLAVAEEEEFDVLVTTDTNLRYQQNLVSRRISIVVLSTTSWPRIKSAATTIAASVDSATPSGYIEIAIP